MKAKDFFNPVCDHVSPHRLARLPAAGVILHTQQYDGLTIARYQPEGGMPLQWRILEPEQPVKMDRVELVRAEGPTAECGAKVCHREWRKGTGQAGSIFEHDWQVSPLINASSVFMEWGRSAPRHGGYDKCDFAVYWEDGSEYQGRFDLQYGGKDGDENFCESFRRRLWFYSGLATVPRHFYRKNAVEEFTEVEARQRYHRIVSPMVQTCRDILGKAEL